MTKRALALVLALSMSVGIVLSGCTDSGTSGVSEPEASDGTSGARASGCSSGGSASVAFFLGINQSSFFCCGFIRESLLVVMTVGAWGLTGVGAAALPPFGAEAEEAAGLRRAGFFFGAGADGGAV